MNENETVATEQVMSMPKQTFIWAAVLAFIALLGWGLLNSNAERPDEMAPDFQMQFYDGYGWEDQSSAALIDWQGKVIVLNFWASWCLECRLEADLLEASWRKYQNSDVIFIGIAYVDAEPNALAYLEEFSVTYPNAPDLRSLITSRYEITGVPETFFIDKNGQIVHIQIGPVNASLLNGMIEQLLAEGEGS